MVCTPPLNLYKNPALAMRHHLFCSFMMGGKINVTAFGFVLFLQTWILTLQVFNKFAPRILPKVYILKNCWIIYLILKSVEKTVTEKTHLNVRGTLRLRETDNEGIFCKSWWLIVDILLHFRWRDSDKVFFIWKLFF